MTKVSYMNSYDGSESRDVEINDILKSISGDYFKAKVEKIRCLINDGKKKEAGELKKILPGFTPYGTFKSKRRSKVK